MYNQKIRDKICELVYQNSMLFDYPSFDNSILVVTNSGNVIYDYLSKVNEHAEESKQEKDVIESVEDEEVYDVVTGEAFCEDFHPVMLEPVKLFG